MSPPLFGAAAGSQSILFLGLLLFGGVSIFVIIAAIRRNREALETHQAATALRSSRTRRAASLAYPVNVVLGYDGFWLEGATIPAGALIVYVYMVATNSHSGQIRYVPRANGHFVYTGAKPDGVEVIRVSVDGADSPDVEYFPPDTIDTTDSSTAAVAWYATQDHRPENTPVERSDPPAY